MITRLIRAQTFHSHNLTKLEVIMKDTLLALKLKKIDYSKYLSFDKFDIFVFS